MAGNELSINVLEFKTRRLRLLDDLAAGRLTRIHVLRRGKPLAVISAAVGKSARLADVYGSMKGQSRAVVEHDLTKPIYDGPDPHDPLLSGGRDAV